MSDIPDIAPKLWANEGGKVLRRLIINLYINVLWADISKVEFQFT